MGSRFKAPSPLFAEQFEAGRRATAKGLKAGFKVSAPFLLLAVCSCVWQAEKAARITHHNGGWRVRSVRG
jgi:hypothetical protein